MCRPTHQLGRDAEDWIRSSTKEETIKSLSVFIKTNTYLTVLTLQKIFFLQMHLQIKDLFDIYFLI